MRNLLIRLARWRDRSLVAKATKLMDKADWWRRLRRRIVLGGDIRTITTPEVWDDHGIARDLRAKPIVDTRDLPF